MVRQLAAAVFVRGRRPPVAGQRRARGGCLALSAALLQLLLAQLGSVEVAAWVKEHCCLWRGFCTQHRSALSCVWGAFPAWGVAAKPLGHTRNVVPCTLNSLLDSPRGLRACTAVSRGPPRSGTGVTQCRAFFGYGSSRSGFVGCQLCADCSCTAAGAYVHTHEPRPEVLRGVSQPPATSACGWGCCCVQCCCSGGVSKSAALHVLHKVSLPLRLCNDASSAFVLAVAGVCVLCVDRGLWAMPVKSKASTVPHRGEWCWPADLSYCWKTYMHV